MQRRGEPWTEDELARLKELLTSGGTMRDAARELGRTEEAARTKALKAGFLQSRLRRKS
jgi:hypothetical protein